MWKFMNRRKQRGKIYKGGLIRRKDGKKITIENYIPRFVKEDGYAESFDYQWNRFRTLQHDSKNGNNLAEERLLKDTEWDKNQLAESVIIECGCGPGRFTEIFCRYCCCCGYERCNRCKLG